MKKLKVLMAIPLPPPEHGGIACWSRIIRDELGKDPDLELDFVDTNTRYRAVTNLSLRARLVGGSAQAVRDTYRIFKKIWKNRPDLLHLTTSGGLATSKDLLILYICKYFRVPCVIHYHMGRLPGIFARAGIQYRMLCRIMQMAAAVSPLDRNSKATIKNALPEANVVQLPNMVEIDDIDRICKEEPAPAPCPGGSIRLVFAGHIVPAKGVRELVTACTQLSDCPLVLDILGPADPDFQMELEKIAAKMKNGEWLRFLGTVSREKTVRHIADADLFVLPSYTEGMPYVVLEAMTCGRAILGTTVGAVPEMLDIGGPQECGVCVPPRNAEALADAIRRLIGDPELRRKWGCMARERAEQLYSIPVGCSQLLDVWRSVTRTAKPFRGSDMTPEKPTKKTPFSKEPMNNELDPHVIRHCRGRALYIGRQGELYIARRYAIYRSDDGGATWQLDSFVPASGWKPLFTWTRLAARLLRYYIAAFEILPDGSRIAVARDGIYRAGPGETAMTCVFRYTRGSRPLNIAIDGNRTLFGEYGNLDACEVRIYVSEDNGRTFDVGYHFPLGDMRHIHNILVDPYRNHYWVLAGDFDRQPGIAALSKDMKTLDWIIRGSQNCRAVNAIITPDRLIYGMDSNQQRNFIVAMDKQSGRVQDLLEVEGNSLHAASFGPIMAISTCVEPNLYCLSKECAIYLSRDGDTWQRALPHRKDRLHPILFQYGTLVLPYSHYQQPKGMFSGQAIQDADNTIFLLEWNTNDSRQVEKDN